MASMMMAPLRALTVTSSSLIIRLSSSQSEYQGPVSLPSSSGSYCSYAPLVYCGRGDKKTAKGKRFRHSFGNSRPRNKNKGRGPPRIPVRRLLKATPMDPSRNFPFHFVTLPFFSKPHQQLSSSSS